MIFITGVTGFIGRALSSRMIESGFHVVGMVRDISVASDFNIDVVEGDLLNLQSFNTSHFSGADVLIHAAAQAHSIGAESKQLVENYYKINYMATLELARMAANSGVKRFVFISSVIVNGNISNEPFTESDPLNPSSAKSEAKSLAETGLLQIANETGMEVVILRPCLVYGSGVPGNFGTLIKLVKKGIPLPFALVDNKRSLIAIDNLVDIIVLCSDMNRSPKAANEVFFVSDESDVSTSDMIRMIADAYKVPCRLLPVPVWLMSFMAKLLGKQSMANNLFGNLQVDSSKAKRLLGWAPKVTMKQQLAKMEKR